MKISDAGLDLIKFYEKCKLKAYLCQAGKWTIGWGHTGPEVHEGMEITQEQADLILAMDVARFERCVSKMCRKATQSAFDAMVALAFNIGEGWEGKKHPGEKNGFRQSSVARLHNSEKYGEAAQAFALWNKTKGKVSRGLTARRAAEAALYLTDQFDEDYLPPSEAEGENPLSQSRTLNGQVGATAATAATVAASQIDLNTISENSEMLIQFLPYIKEYWWVFAAIAAGFIVFSMYGRIKDRLEGRA